MFDRRFDFPSLASTLGRVILSSVLATAGLAAHADSSWIADTKGCKHFDPRPAVRPNESVTWTGACVDGFAEGNGVQQWFLNGEMVENCTVDKKHGQLSGQATCQWPNTERYDGDFSDGKRTGHGVSRWANGNSYEGDFVDGKRTGHGIFRWANGNAYEGDFLDNQQTGHGVFTTPRGDRIEGEYLNGDLSGHALVQLADGQRYEGNSVADFVAGLVANKGLSSSLVCPKMARLEVPPVHWHGTVKFSATATVRDGHVTEVVVTTLTDIGNSAVENVLVEAISRTLKRYECMGDHVFEQQFNFTIE